MSSLTFVFFYSYNTFLKKTEKIYIYIACPSSWCHGSSSTAPRNQDNPVQGVIKHASIAVDRIARARDKPGQTTHALWGQTWQSTHQGEAFPATPSYAIKYNSWLYFPVQGSDFRPIHTESTSQGTGESIVHFSELVPPPCQGHPRRKHVSPSGNYALENTVGLYLMATVGGGAIIQNLLRQKKRFLLWVPLV